MDTDKDKNISYEELLFWVFRSIHSLDARNSKQTFREADSNRDDQLAFDEFLTYSVLKNVSLAPKLGLFGKFQNTCRPKIGILNIFDFLAENHSENLQK